MIHKRPSWIRNWSILLVLVALGGAAFMWWHRQAAAPEFVTESVTRGNVVRTIVTTGTVNPVTTVQVGSYVSGVIQSLSCDFNTKVKAGQLCAKIDPRPYQVVFDQATANLASARAQLKKDQASLTYARLNYERDMVLNKQGIVSQDTVDNDKNILDQASAQVGVDEATITERQAALDAAKVNLDYTDIVSPVDGTVVSRSIDVGQTVAASFQTPTLFLIAKDLTQMQVDTNVSESDVGEARVDQKALFTVEAYPNKVFEGKVKQVRQAPITVQNVVTYDVVISVENPDLMLLPGMTANTRIVTDEHDNVLRVPIQALRYSPPGQEHSDNSAATGGNKLPPQHVYVLRHGKPQRVPVTVVLNDGTYAEISGEGINNGDNVVVNEIRSDSARPEAPKRSPLRL
jgi:HlyD family secretion protein